MQESWIAISAARARAHRLYGVRGWLVTLLWLNTLPMLVLVQAMIGILAAGAISGGTLLSLSSVLLLPVLVAVAFMRVRWFPVLWFVYCMLRLPAALYTGYRVMWGLAHTARVPDTLPMMLASVLDLLMPIVTVFRNRMPSRLHWACRADDFIWTFWIGPAHVSRSGDCWQHRLMRNWLKSCSSPMPEEITAIAAGKVRRCSAAWRSC